jgi:hypothetical protein
MAPEWLLLVLTRMSAERGGEPQSAPAFLAAWLVVDALWAASVLCLLLVVNKNTSI